MHIEYRILKANYYRILAALIVRDGYGCERCGNTKGLVVDHIIPVKRGGKTELDNLQQLCHGCNGIKGNEIADYRPMNRGEIGKEAPIYTSAGELTIRLWHWTRAGYQEATYKYLDCAVLYIRSKTRVKVRILEDNRMLNAKLRDVYPLDLQHIFPTS